MKRVVKAGAAALGLALALAAPASAGTLSVSGGSVVFQANPGETNLLTAQFTFRTGIVALVRDKGGPITAGPGCVAVGQRGVCPLAPLKIQIFAGDRHDSATVTGAAVEFHGGDGNDAVTGDDYADQLYGDGGDDRLHGGAKQSAQSFGAGGDDSLYGGNGNDVLIAGPGDDGLFGEAGSDVLDGGADGDQLDGGIGADVIRGGGNTIDQGAGIPRRFVDRVQYWDRTAPLHVTIDGAANDGEAGEGDNVAADVEEVYGGLGNDTLEAPVAEAPDDYSAIGFEHSLFGRGGDDLLVGGSRRNRLHGDDGNDTLRGNAGRDLLEGEAGDDTLFARDGEADRVNCGFGADAAQIDLGLDTDPFSTTCETFLP